MTSPADPYTPTVLPTEPVGVFGCTVRQVGALARNITITEQPVEDRDPDLSITTEEITTWIGQLDATLTARLVSLARLQEGERRTALLAAGADAIANGAASYAEAAAHPEFAAPADAVSYAALLWSRWKQGADQVAAALDAILAEGGTDVTSDPKVSPAWKFPPASLPDGKRW